MFTTNSIVLSEDITNIFSSLSSTLGQAFNSRFNMLIKKLFANNEQGFAYDPNDLTTLYQAVGGTIPVTKVVQPIGKSLDKSGRNNHAYQSTSASRPTLSARVNELVATEDLSSVLWREINGSVVGNDKFTPNTTLGIHRISQAIAPSTGVQKKLSGRVKYAGVPFIYINAVQTIRASLCINLQTGAFISSGEKIKNISVVMQSDGWIDFSFEGETYEVNNPLYFQANTSLTTSDNSYTGNGVDGFLLSKVDMRRSSSSTIIPTYQKVESNTAYDNRNFPRYFKYDKVDDKLTTNLPTKLTGCTVIRSVPNVGTQILTNQTIPATYEDDTDHCGLIVINRALTPSETSAITAEFNKRAGV